MNCRFPRKGLLSALLASGRLVLRVTGNGRQRRAGFLVGLVTLAVAGLVGCSKDRPTKPPANPGNGLADNVVQVDSTKTALVSDSTALASGTYIYRATAGTLPALKQGDILAGLSDGGYLRKVISVAPQHDSLVVHTSQATLADAIPNGSFSLVADSAMIQRSKSAGRPMGTEQSMSGSVPLGDIELLSDGINTLALKNGTLNYDFSRFSVTGTIDGYHLATLDASLAGTTALSCSLVWHSAQSLNLNGSKTIYTASRWTTFPGPLPIPVQITYEADVNWSLKCDAAFTETKQLCATSTLDTGASYGSAGWDGRFSPTFNACPDTSRAPEFHANAEARVEVVPKLTMKIFGVVGPEIDAIPYADAQAHAVLQSTGLLWDAELMTGLDAHVAVSAAIFDSGITGYDQRFTGPSTEVWRAPKTVQVVKGNNQHGMELTALTDSLEVRVLDSTSPGHGVPGVAVSFAVTGGAGSVHPAVATTDGSGIARTAWTLGRGSQQQAQATAVDHLGQTLTGMPSSFGAAAAPKVWVCDISFCGGCSSPQVPAEFRLSGLVSFDSTYTGYPCDEGGRYFHGVRVTEGGTITVTIENVAHFPHDRSPAYEYNLEIDGLSDPAAVFRNGEYHWAWPAYVDSAQTTDTYTIGDIADTSNVKTPRAAVVPSNPGGLIGLRTNRP